jgi:hypothetical protein
VSGFEPLAGASTHERAVAAAGWFAEQGCAELTLIARDASGRTVREDTLHARETDLPGLVDGAVASAGAAGEVEVVAPGLARCVFTARSASRILLKAAR